MPFISLPADVLINILLFVDGFSLIRCKQVCKTLSILIERDIGLRYNLELYLTSSIDIPHHLPHLSKKQRLTTLQQLHKRKQRWGINWYHETIANTHQSGIIWDWSWEYQGGVLACLTRTHEVWCFEFLKSGSSLRGVGSDEAMERSWVPGSVRKRVVRPSPLLGHASGLYLDPKQDLLVIIYSVDLNGDPPFRIHFLSLSNGTAYTGCHKPLLEVNHYLDGILLLFDVRIYAHLLGFSFLRDEEVLVAVFDWKLGELKAVIEGRSFMFLDTQHILVDQVNPLKSRLEFIVYDIAQGTPILILPFPLEDRYDLEFGKDIPFSDSSASSSSSSFGEGKTSASADVEDDGYPFMPDPGLTMITVSIRIHPEDTQQIIVTFPVFVIQSLLVQACANIPSTVTSSSSSSSPSSPSPSPSTPINITTTATSEPPPPPPSTPTPTPTPTPLEIPWGSWAQCTFLLPTIPTPTAPNPIICTATYGCRIAVSRNTSAGVGVGVDIENEGTGDEVGGGSGTNTSSVMVYKFHPRWFLGERVREMRVVDIGGGGGGGGNVDEGIAEGTVEGGVGGGDGELEIQMEMGSGLAGGSRVGSTGIPTSIKTIPLPPVESVVNTMGEQSYIWMDQDLLGICLRKGVQFVRA